MSTTPTLAPEMEAERLLSLKDLAKLFGVSVDSIRRLSERDPSFPPAIYVFPKRPRWLPDQVRAYLHSLPDDQAARL